LPHLRLCLVSLGERSELRAHSVVDLILVSIETDRIN
jgi:hypothetical protein